MVLFSLAGWQRLHAESFANPIDVLVADPFILKDAATYCLYGTSESDGFRVWTSADMINWQDRGKAFQATGASWGKNRFWAPEVVKKGSTYFLFYSAGGAPSDVMRICVASSSSPLGPFVDIAAPLFDNAQAYIDPHVFSEGGTDYLYCAQDMSIPADNKSQIYVATLNPAMTSLSSGLTLCVTPGPAWEFNGGFSWNEAPAVMKRGSAYYLLYSGGLYSSAGYSIGYATATSPLGPWTKHASNPIIKATASVSGPGHASLVASPDGLETWIAYHTHQQLSGGGNRQLSVDRVAFTPLAGNPDTLSVPGAPSVLTQNAPGGAVFPQGGSDQFSGASLDRSKWVVFNENVAQHSQTGGKLSITTADGDLYEAVRADARNVFLQYAPSGDFQIIAKLNFSPIQNFEQAHIIVWQDHNNYVRLSDVFAYWNQFEFSTEVAADWSAQGIVNSIGADKYLRLSKSGNAYSAWVSANGSSWTQIGAPRTLALRDIKIGFGAKSPVSTAARVAQFDYFQLQAPTAVESDWALYQ